jgi:hypothetical protein
MPVVSYYGAAAPDVGRGVPAAGSSTTLRVIEAYIAGVMVLANTAQGLERVAAVAHGAVPNLGQFASFRQLAAIAPANAAATVYGSAQALGSLLPSLPISSRGTPTAGSSLFVTLSWTTAGLEVTYDTLAR